MADEPKDLGTAEDEFSAAMAEAFAAATEPKPEQAPAPATGDAPSAPDAHPAAPAPGPQEEATPPPAPDELDQKPTDTQEETGTPPEDDGGMETLLREKELSVEDKAHRFDSMHGRLAKERKEKEALQAELAALKAQAPGAAPASGPKPDAQPKPTPQAATIEDENLRTLLDEFSAANPQLAALAREDSRDGQRIRKRLEDYGADLALDAAESILMRREQHAEHEKFTAEQEASLRETAVRAHQAAIYAAHPDVGKVMGDPEMKAVFDTEMSAWIDSLPFGEGSRYAAIRSGGSAQEVIGMLNDFKRHLKDGKAGAQKDADAAQAVASRGAPGPHAKVTPPDPDDYSAGVADALAIRARGETGLR